MTLIAIGLLVSALGTLIGVGGGFLLVPILLFLNPGSEYVWIVALSMWLVTLNATSGSITYFLKGKVHLKAAVVFILAALPGSVMGVWLERFVSRSHFELIFGAALILYSAFLLLKGSNRKEDKGLDSTGALSTGLYVKGAVVSFFVGFIAAFLGIGGGVIHVPLLVFALGFPVHMAVGTSQFILAVTALAATGAHLWHGDIDLQSPAVWQLGGAAVVGAQIGAALSKRVSGLIILRILAVALLLVGLRLIAGGLKG